ncbi:MAG: gamma carbonic anhydrase family protein [Candidatus Thorarchaeota archaeon]|jgi:carbonic anhydrase/acetyltransferase-like protein (isoleucine patch superfamily)
MVVYAFGDDVPEIAKSAFIHPQASVIGSVKIGERVFVAPMASIRGDYGKIEIGDETNIQDGAVVHSDPSYLTYIGSRVNIGHNASIHSESIGNGAAIGMGAVLMSGSKVAKGVLIGNSALLHPKTVTEPNGVYAGVPAKFLRILKSDDPARKAIDDFIESYIKNALTYPDNLKRLDI